MSILVIFSIYHRTEFIFSIAFLNKIYKNKANGRVKEISIWAISQFNALNTHVSHALIDLGSCKNNAISDQNEPEKDKEKKEKQEKREKIKTVQRNFQKIIALKNHKQKW